MRSNRVGPQDNAEDNSEEASGVHLANTSAFQGGVCRICLEEDLVMIQPCICTGSIQYVHEKCMISWIKSQLSRHSTRNIYC